MATKTALKKKVNIQEDHEIRERIVQSRVRLLLKHPFFGNLATRLKLKNADDPLLFCNLGNDYFYLIDKWGNDLSYFRKISMWPFKSLKNILIFIAFFSLLITLIIPNEIFKYDNSPNAQFFITYLFMLKSIVAIVIFFGFSLGKNFNTAIWNRKYFN